LSDISFIDINSETIFNEMVSDFESVLGETLYPGDERRIFLQQLLPVLVGTKSNINESAKLNLLRYATGTYLDAIGERTDTVRLAAQKAKATIRFTLSAAQGTNITIPLGTRVTPDGKLYFATILALTIVAGQTTGDVVVESTVGGQIYNGFNSGQIKTLVDPVAFVASVSNTDASSGGADIEADDDDINVWSGYRERIRESFNKVSAGSEAGYIYWAKTASADIVDVSVESPSAGNVQIVVLMKNGGIPTQTVLDYVLSVCTDSKRKALTDQITVATPVAVPYNIAFTYYISSSMSAEINSIQTAITKAVDEYKVWQCAKLGQAINPDKLRQLVLNAGASKITITAPVEIAVSSSQVASLGTYIPTYGGLY
jgi:phage-related baseplate assembly protein